MGYILPLLTFGYWFSLTPPPFLGIFAKIVWIFMLVLIVIGLVISGVELASRKNKSLRDKWQFDKYLRRAMRREATLAVWAGIVGLLLYWFAQQQLPILSMRFFFIIWLVGFGWWKWVILRDLKTRDSSLKADAEKAAYEKWLPKPKK